MKFLLISIASLCILSTATGLNCYSCMAEDADCKENSIECDGISTTAGLTQMLVHKPSLAVIVSSSHKCYTFVVEPVASGKALTVKGCTYDSTDVCAGSPITGEQKQCRTCAENECNGAVRLQLGSSAALGLLVAVALTLWGGYYKQ